MSSGDSPSPNSLFDAFSARATLSSHIWRLLAGLAGFVSQEMEEVILFGCLRAVVENGSTIQTIAG